MATPHWGRLWHQFQEVRIGQDFTGRARGSVDLDQWVHLCYREWAADSQLKLGPDRGRDMNPPLVLVRAVTTCNIYDIECSVLPDEHVPEWSGVITTVRVRRSSGRGNINPMMRTLIGLAAPSAKDARGCSPGLKRHVICK
ncbi:hypothetical protein BST61_g7481 [Cercospora zeina]